MSCDITDSGDEGQNVLVVTLNRSKRTLGTGSIQFINVINEQDFASKKAKKATSIIAVEYCFSTGLHTIYTQQ